MFKKIFLKLLAKNKKFAEISKEWLDYKKKYIKESTYCYYNFVIDKYLNSKFGNEYIHKIDNYNEFIGELLIYLKVKTVRDIINILRAILKYYETEYSRKLKYREIILPKQTKNSLEILDDIDKRKIIEYCSNECNLKCLGIIVVLNTGMRIGEVCALKWENIDLDKKIIYIRSTLQRVYFSNSRKSCIITHAPKTHNSVRRIPINKNLYKIFKSIKKFYNESDYFLTGNDKKFIEPRNYQYFFKSILKKCGIKEYKFHILRHTFATNCMEIGMDIKSLSEILGHSNVNTTLSIYVHSSDKIKQKYLEKL